MNPAREIVRNRFEQALADFKTQLKPNDIKDFEDTTFEILQRAIATIQKRHVSERRQRCFKRLNNLLEAVKQFGSVVDIFANASPFVAFIWGPIKFLIQTTENFAQGLDSLLEAYQEISENFPLLEAYKGLFEKEPRAGKVLELIFKDILNFHLHALRFFKRPVTEAKTVAVWKQLFEATWKSYKTRFEALQENLRRHQDLLAREVDLRVLEEMQDARIKHERQVLEMEKNEDLRSRREVYTWLAAVEALTDQNDCIQVRYKSPGTSHWLLGHPKFQSWIDSRSAQKPLLWLTGKPGAGKTILASLAIEEAQRWPDTAVVYFYFKHGDSKKNNFLSMARAMMSQLLTINPDLLPYLYEKASRGAGLTVPKLAYEYLTTALESVGRLYLIIDGLDECPAREQKLIIQLLNDVLVEQKYISHRYLIISRDEDLHADTRELLKRYIQLKITPADNQNDIKQFCEFWSKKIQQKFGLSDSKAKDIARKVSHRANGMFLYAKLVLENLHDQLRANRLNYELDEKLFPKKIKDAYARIIDRICNESPESHRDEAMTILGWLICAKRPLKWYEIRCAESINEDDHTIDADNRPVDECKNVCGSLIEIRSDGTVELVHLTARYYLREKLFHSVSAKELELAQVCMQYLSLDGFNAQLDVVEIRKNILNGYYSFFEYAITYWSDHLRGARSLLGAISADDDCTSIKELIDAFVEVHAEEVQPGYVVTSDLEEYWHCLANCASFTQFLMVVEAQENQKNASGPEAEPTKVLDLSRTLLRVRGILEQSTTSEKAGLEALYGKKIFKCRRMNCVDFYDGYEDVQKRNDHINKHDRPFRCSYPDCKDPVAAWGYDTLKKLDAHLLEHDRWLYMKDDDFPDYQLLASHPDPTSTGYRPGPKKGTQKAKRADLECETCGQQFTRRFNLRVHRNIHEGEKPYKCNICHKAFARQYDRDRHERGHFKTTEFVCNVTVTDSNSTTRTIGCGKGFAVVEILKDHLESTDGQACMKNVLDLEISEGADQYFTTTGIRLPAALIKRYKELLPLLRVTED